MSKAYSNKALPPGTILREWRLENVLGVGGFGIVYKGRGIYFDELVAIKEYFPSSISERDEDATVVPIDSDAEEVHALGLKKFVEEAKLLWNLSTPTRHPNIVSVRSLFEIHGTAYMVMDFEDGLSLSKMIKSGTKWNEASLSKLIRPIAEGLERAHRVGVLHRDIKPPNILVNDDGRSVLIDFGSARFESGEATSTKVTFHTPPYAAIEQYVKTYDQGPWTDIYALGVVLYECVTGTKPAEVLERMHGEAGKPLAEGDWPGYSKKFLAAIDTAMKIKPSERPQSISAWLEFFDKGEEPAAPAEEEDDDATRIADFAATTEDLAPVAPPPGFSKDGKVETAVPSDPAEVQFKRAGQDTGAGKKVEEVPPPPQVKDKAPAEAKDGGKDPPKDPPKDAAKDAAKPGADPKKDAGKAKPAGGAQKKLSPAMIGGAAAVVLLLGAGGWYLSSGGSSGEPDSALLENADAADEAAVVPVDIDAAGGVAAAVKAFADDAGKAGAPAAAVKRLNDAATQLTQMESGLKTMAADPAQADAVKKREAEMDTVAKSAAVDFANLVLREADGRVGRLARDLPWADPRNAGASAGQNAARQKVARDIRLALSGVRSAAADAAKAADPAAALTAARLTLARNGTYKSAIARAYRTGEGNAATASNETAPGATASEAPAATTSAAAPTSSEPASDAQRRQLKSVLDSARDISKRVIRLGERDRPGASATDDEKEKYRIRQANVGTARDYERYLDTLENSMRGTRTQAEADQLIASANQTKNYLSQLLASSNATLN